MGKLGFFKALIRMWKRTFDYKNDASKREYLFPYLFHLFLAILTVALIVLSVCAVFKWPSLTKVFSMAASIVGAYIMLSVFPMASLTVRRVRALGISGFFLPVLSTALAVGCVIAALCAFNGSIEIMTTGTI